MRIKQISVFVGNEAGRLVNMLKPFFDKQINIRALSVADAADFGIIRIVASDTEGAVKALHDAEFTLQVNEVLAYEIPDTPGGLLKTVAEPLAKAGINLEYFYGSISIQSETGKAMVILRVDDLVGAERVLESS